MLLVEAGLPNMLVFSSMILCACVDVCEERVV